MTQQAPALALQRSAGAEDASAVCEMLTLDCSGLLEEIKKNEGIGSQLAGLFVQSDAPNVKELTLEALAHLQQLRVNGPTLDAVRKSTVSSCQLLKHARCQDPAQARTRQGLQPGCLQSFVPRRCSCDPSWQRASRSTTGSYRTR